MESEVATIYQDHAYIGWIALSQPRQQASAIQRIKRNAGCSMR
jgi:hypothetical protein